MEIGHVLRELKPDGTLECEDCGMKGRDKRDI